MKLLVPSIYLLISLFDIFLHSLNKENFKKSKHPNNHQVLVDKSYAI